MMKYTLTYRWRGGPQAIEAIERFRTLEEVFLAFARDIVHDARHYAEKRAPDEITLTVTAPSGRRLVHVTLSAEALANAFGTVENLP